VETFVALKCAIDNWRWAGVPFYLRTGKRLAEGRRIISIAFREPPRSMFPVGSGIGAQGPDHLTFDLADAAKSAITLSISTYHCCNIYTAGPQQQAVSLPIRWLRPG
jgi:glucose-6-phosphate 1-dehydrogenase